MDFEYTSEQRVLREEIRSWHRENETEFREFIRRGEFPRDLYEEGMKAGFGNVIVPEEYGGAGGGAM